jgi:hypothetical protein
MMMLRRVFLSLFGGAYLFTPEHVLRKAGLAPGLSTSGAGPAENPQGYERECQLLILEQLVQPGSYRLCFDQMCS